MKQLKGYNAEAVGRMEREALDKYKNMSEDALVDALMSQVCKSKSDGSFNPNELKSFAEMMSPHLTPAKRERLDNIIRLINSDM